MSEFLLNLEKNANQIQPSLLVVPGIVSVIIGLSLWLAGLSFTKLLAAIAGTIVAATIAFVTNANSPARITLIAVAGAVIGVIIQAILTAGPPIWRLFSAFVYAAAGTAIIFMGMILLLLYKGSSPLTYVAQKQSYFCAVAAGMIICGTFEQLLLCRRQRDKQISAKQNPANQIKGVN